MQTDGSRTGKSRLSFSDANIFGLMTIALHLIQMFHFSFLKSVILGQDLHFKILIIWRKFDKSILFRFTDCFCFVSIYSLSRKPFVQPSSNLTDIRAKHFIPLVYCFCFSPSKSYNLTLCLSNHHLIKMVYLFVLLSALAVNLKLVIWPFEFDPIFFLFTLAIVSVLEVLYSYLLLCVFKLVHLFRLYETDTSIIQRIIKI